MFDDYASICGITEKRKLKEYTRQLLARNKNSDIIGKTDKEIQCRAGSD